ncbi:hypothetical protein HELRODRAFT_116974 [Helobdella robusta]|uniref:Dolichyl-phosphate beta-glucosyltransferase n=1 Tax=Helobdella robusta TaxID=6412 RepID=T1EGJ0_HELRO|nr:hypothetical protein HELRODRAFT_116974 [Helobdella robusta]ESO10431.1 hypothetical protein HELRODRAFT_116974 [Helobdella robusta]
MSIIVPAYNEEDRLSLMMDETMEYLQKRNRLDPKFTYEVIVVDDGSKDDTSKIALKYSRQYGSDKVRVLTQVTNRGKGGAVKMGVLRCRGKYILFCDADGATKFSDVNKLEAELKKLIGGEVNDDRAVVCGSRAHLEKDSIAKRSVFRTILMYVFHFCVWFLCVRGVKDTQCGFKLFSRAAARLFFFNLHVHRWAFDVDLLHIAQHYNVPIAEVAVSWTEIPGSKLSPLWASLQMGRDLFLIRLRYLTGSWSMVEDRWKEEKKKDE